MGNQAVDVKVETNSVMSAVTKFETIGDVQSAMASSLSEINRDLIANWKGEAGNKFEFASICVENMLSEIAEKNARYSWALVDLTKQFDALDQELASGLSVKVRAAKGVDANGITA